MGFLHLPYLSTPYLGEVGEHDPVCGMAGDERPLHAMGQRALSTLLGRSEVGPPPRADCPSARCWPPNFSGSVDLLEVWQSPRLVEERLGRTVEAEVGEPAL